MSKLYEDYSWNVRRSSELYHIYDQEYINAVQLLN